MPATSLFNFTCPDDLKNWVRKQSEAMGVSMATIVIIALREYQTNADRFERAATHEH